jgi:hypothetical protein
MSASNGSWCDKHLALVAKKDGYEVIRGGWPDFLLVKDGKALFVEVKSKGSPVRPTQLKYLRVLEQLGLNVRISVNGEISNLVTLDEYLALLKTMTQEEKLHQMQLGREMSENVVKVQ